MLIRYHRRDIRVTPFSSIAKHFIPAIIIAALSGCGSDSPVVPVSVATVAVTPGTSILFAGITLQLSATPLDANGNVLPGRAVSWSTSDASAARVNAMGEVTFVGPGTVTISAASEGKTGSAQVLSLVIPVSSVEVTPAVATVLVGATLQLTARTLSNTGVPLPGRAVTWTSSNESRATVSATGLVTAVGAGAVTITATSEGQSASAGITIGPAS